MLLFGIFTHSQIDISIYSLDNVAEDFVHNFNYVSFDGVLVCINRIMKCSIIAYFHLIIPSIIYSL